MTNLSDYEKGRRDVIRDLLKAIRNAWESELKPDKRIVISIEVENNELRSQFYKNLKDTRFDDVLVSMPSKKHTEFVPLHIVKTKHPPVKDNLGDSK